MRRPHQSRIGRQWRLGYSLRSCFNNRGHRAWRRAFWGKASTTSSSWPRCPALKRRFCLNACRSSSASLTRLPRDGSPLWPRYVDVVISEAESGFGTPELTLSYPPSAQRRQPAPVVTPDPSYSSQDGSYPGEVSRLTIDSSADRGLSMTNQHDGVFTPPKASSSQTTVSLLYKLIKDLPGIKDVPGAPPISPDAGMDLMSKQRTEFALLEELQKASQHKVDVVLLQSRDVELDAIGQGYTDYAMCGNESPLEKVDSTTPKLNKHDLCKLRVALDRIFWKGDYLEYVAVTGKNLKDILSESQRKDGPAGPTRRYRPHRSGSSPTASCSLLSPTSPRSTRTTSPCGFPSIHHARRQTRARPHTASVGRPSPTMHTIGCSPATSWPRIKLSTVRLRVFPRSTTKETNDVYITAPHLSTILLPSIPWPMALPSSPPLRHKLRLQPRRLRPPLRGLLTLERRLRRTRRSRQRLDCKPKPALPADAALADRLCQGGRQLHFAAPVGGKSYVANFQGVSDAARLKRPTSQELDLELASRITGSFFGPRGKRQILRVPIVRRTKLPSPTTARSSAISPADQSTPPIR